MSSPRQRLFLAAAVPEAEAERLAALQPSFSERPGMRWVPPQNLHVTLKFLGDAPEAAERQLSEALAGAVKSVPAGGVWLSGLGAFPRTARASVLWAGIEDPARVLTRLAGALEDCAASFGFPREDRRFTPHVTLARFRRSIDLGELPGFPPGAPWTVQSVGLFSSRPGSGAPVYERRNSYPLA